MISFGKRNSRVLASMNGIGGSCEYSEWIAAHLDTNSVSDYSRIMENVTITLEEEVARWARIKAAQQDTSVSRLVGDMLKEKMEQEQSYHSAMQRYLSRKPLQLSEPGVSYPRREELHER